MTTTPASAQISKIRFTSYEDLPQTTVDRINHIIHNYLHRRPFPENMMTPMMPFWYDHEVFQQRRQNRRGQRSSQRLYG